MGVSRIKNLLIKTVLLGTCLTVAISDCMQMPAGAPAQPPLSVMIATGLLHPAAQGSSSPPVKRLGSLENRIAVCCTCAKSTDDKGTSLALARRYECDHLFCTSCHASRTKATCPVCSERCTQTGHVCSICLGPLDSPVKLVCNHIFCRSCIKSWQDTPAFNNAAQRVERRCPICSGSILYTCGMCLRPFIPNEEIDYKIVHTMHEWVTMFGCDLFPWPATEIVHYIHDTCINEHLRKLLHKDVEVSPDTVPHIRCPLHKEFLITLKEGSLDLGAGEGPNVSQDPEFQRDVEAEKRYVAFHQF